MTGGRPMLLIAFAAIVVATACRENARTETVRRDPVPSVSVRSKPKDDWRTCTPETFVAGRCAAHVFADVAHRTFGEVDGLATDDTWALAIKETGVVAIRIEDGERGPQRDFGMRVSVAAIESGFLIGTDVLASFDAGSGKTTTLFAATAGRRVDSVRAGASAATWTEWSPKLRDSRAWFLDLTNSATTEIPAAKGAAVFHRRAIVGHRVVVGTKWYDSATKALAAPAKPIPPGELTCGASRCAVVVWPCATTLGHECPSDATLSSWDPASGALEVIAENLSPMWVHVTSSGRVLWLSEGVVWSSNGAEAPFDVARHVCNATASDRMLVTYEQHKSGCDTLVARPLPG